MPQKPTRARTPDCRNSLLQNSTHSWVATVHSPTNSHGGPSIVQMIRPRIIGIASIPRLFALLTSFTRYERCTHRTPDHRPGSQNNTPADANALPQPKPLEKQLKPSRSLNLSCPPPLNWPLQRPA